MVELIFGIGFVILGTRYIYIAFDIKRSNDIYKIRNNMLKPENIKDKDGYLKFNFIINVIVGIAFFIDGLFAILSKYFLNLDDISSSINLISCLIILGCILTSIFTVTKFKK